jgi:hypothetical protein
MRAASHLALSPKQSPESNLLAEGALANQQRTSQRALFPPHLRPEKESNLHQLAS